MSQERKRKNVLTSANALVATQSDGRCRPTLVATMVAAEPRKSYDTERNCSPAVRPYTPIRRGGGARDTKGGGGG